MNKRLSVLFFVFLILLGFGVYAVIVSSNSNWRTASRQSAHISVLASEEHRAIVQVFTARAFSWRGLFSVHSWIAFKPKGAANYTVTEVIGWRKSQNLPVVVVKDDIPDRRWYNATPELIFEIIGDNAENAISQIRKAIETYPYKNDYLLWPGPNSNTYIAHIIREVQQLTVELPPNAMGKDWLNEGTFSSVAQGGSGFQFSLYGLFGFTFGIADGVEINLFGLCFGVDILNPALKLPLIGRIGVRDS